MESIIYELRANDVKEDDIEFIMKRVKNRISEENIDAELQKLGYPKIFTVDYDQYNEYDDYDDYDSGNSSGYNGYNDDDEY
ncbi:hypothetical protein [Halarcobacter ebronensis]|uniref:Uncharacterized protein n=1 Tax=Halarcobacter ebronensis TaxID=1462615 RepID=A0A4Q1AMU4_9BACT|nr:hypothetical protein [Halarcobacter ebronensis]QKF82818.1 hypothetical protein AEBR_2350 [Halarcobacter ebronensis]RXK06840.1 hypothetical protein CRV07_05260 [Halarcobacter ebronensis]